MLTVFQVCFFTGLFLLILSFLLGQIFDLADVSGLDLDLGGFDLCNIIPLSPTLIILCVTIYGGIGSLIMSLSINFPGWLIVLIAASLAWLFTMLTYHFVVKPLKKAENTSAPDLEELIGLAATVSETILPGRFGEIRYVIHGNSFTAPAKSVDTEKLATKTQVVICRIEDGVFYVQQLHKEDTASNDS